MANSSKMPLFTSFAIGKKEVDLVLKHSKKEALPRLSSDEVADLLLVSAFCVSQAVVVQGSCGVGKEPLDKALSQIIQYVQAHPAEEKILTRAAVKLEEGVAGGDEVYIAQALQNKSIPATRLWVDIAALHDGGRINLSILNADDIEAFEKRMPQLRAAKAITGSRRAFELAAVSGKEFLDSVKDRSPIEHYGLGDSTAVACLARKNSHVRSIETILEKIKTAGREQHPDLFPPTLSEKIIGFFARASRRDLPAEQLISRQAAR